MGTVGVCSVTAAELSALNSSYVAIAGNPYVEYYKYGNYRLSLYMEYKVTVAITKQWGPLYYGEVSMPDFPIAFAIMPYVFYSLHMDGTGQDVIAICASSGTRISKTNPGHYFIYSPVSKTITAKIHIYADGRWG